MTTAAVDGARAHFDAGARTEAAAATTAQPRRLNAGGLVDRGRPMRFNWCGRDLTGYAGDTLASALLANGVDVVGRSFKYHRPRGVTSAGVEEAGALVTVGRGARRTPNVNAATCELAHGLAATGQNAWPSVERDAMSVIGLVDQLVGPAFAAGFYYKTFFSALPFGGRGTSHWMRFEKLIRRAAGLGALSDAPDPDRYEVAHSHCDVVVIGSGAAGLAAAEALASAGVDVALVEQDFAFGGRLLSDRGAVDGADPVAWRDARLAAFLAAGGRALARTTAFGLYDGGVVGLVERVDRAEIRERMHILRAGRVVLAAGAIERGLAFANNDRPGVMTASALRTYVNRFGVAPGKRVALAVSDDGGYADLPRMLEAGLSATVLDMREPGLVAVDPPAGVTRHFEVAPMAARGGRAVRGLDFARMRDGAWRVEDLALEVDCVAVSGGWQPTLHLLAQRGVRLEWSPERAAFVAGDQPGRTQPQKEPAVILAGAAAGAETVDDCAESGRAAAAEALGRAAPERKVYAPPARRALFEVKPAGGRKFGKAFVDIQHDVTVEDVRLAEREGFISVEHLKRYTTLGMATDQGKTSNVIGLALMAEARGVDVSEVGTTGFRPPYTPVSIGALAGERRGAHFQPTRRTPMHDWHLARGAVMTDAGLWRRPWYYPRAGEDIDAAYEREAAAVRDTVGMADVSSLGKIMLQGPDAAEFLDRIYVNGFKKLAVGRARYGVMLREDGVVFDDGTVWRLGEQDYLVTTTTTGAGKVLSWMEKLAQTRWPELKLAMASVSDAYAGFSVAGPLARRLLSSALRDCAFDDSSFPPMGVRRARLGDQPALVARLSFSGELAYEVMIASDYGQALADALWDAAAPMGGVLYGLEALGALRIEKGHIAGAELDGRTTLSDLGLGAMASKTKPFIGQALAERQALTDADREALVGLKPVIAGEKFKAGAVLCAPDQVKGHGLGWVSAVTHSPALGHWIGLGLVKGGLARLNGQELVAADPIRGQETRVVVCSPHFIDPEGARMKPEADPEVVGLPAPARPIPAQLARVSALGVYWADDATTRPRSYGRAKVDGLEAPARDAGDGPVWLVEGAPTPVERVVAWPGRRAAVEAALGAAPAPGGSSALRDGGHVLRVGPLAWARVGAATATPLQLSGEDGAVAAIGDGLARLRIGGDRAAALLNRFLPIDLRDRSFAVGAVATTDFDHLPAVLHRVAPQAYDLYVMRSVARDMFAALESAARRIG